MLTVSTVLAQTRLAVRVAVQRRAGVVHDGPIEHVGPGWTSRDGCAPSC